MASDPYNHASLAKRLRDACGATALKDSWPSRFEMHSMFKGSAQGIQAETNLSHTIQLGDYVNIGNANGKTALHFAAQFRGCSIDIVEWLLDSKADVNATTDRGQTPLIFASGRGFNETVQLLLEKGARCRVKTARGDTALSVGKERLTDTTLWSISERQSTETQNWMDFSSDTSAISLEVNYLHRNPRLIEDAKNVPDHLLPALRQQLEQSLVEVNTVSRHQYLFSSGTIRHDEMPLELPLEFQKEQYLTYDHMQEFPFADHIRRIICNGNEVEGCRLADLHRTEEGQRLLQRFRDRSMGQEGSTHTSVQIGGPRDNIWNQRFLAARQAPSNAEKSDSNAMYQHMQCFLVMVQHFVRKCILPDLKTRRVAYQVVPTFRCHLPHTGSSGRPHRDEDYGHSWSEVNYWVPLTTVWGSNSLTAESASGSKDFHAFEAEQGQAVRFWGNQVWHYAIANTTDVTRVSFDLRVIREEEWSPACFQTFRVGEYFGIIDADVGLVTGKALQKLQIQYNRKLA